MSGGPFEFEIEVWSENERLGAQEASIAMCIEDALFRGVQSGRWPNDGTLPEITVTPHREGSKGSALTGLSLALPDGPTREYDRSIFGPQARALIAQLIEGEGLPSDAEMEWRVIAREPRSTASRFSARMTRTPYPFVGADLSHLPLASYSVRLEAPVLRAVHRWVAGPGALEQAGLLLGRLYHDRDRGALELHVTEVVELEPGRGGASSIHFSFQPGSFGSARQAALRRDNSLTPCGWVHSHPACDGCHAKPSCEADTVFFSSMDIEVHTSAFASPFMIGLVAGKLRHLPARCPGFRLYGWDAAGIAGRSFRVCGPGSTSWRDDQATFLEEEK